MTKLPPALLLILVCGACHIGSTTSLATVNKPDPTTPSGSNGSTRRDFVRGTTTTTAAAALLVASTAATNVAVPPSWAAATAAEEEGTSTTSSLPFCVLGANGRTGTKIVQDILGRGLTVRATSRSGVYQNSVEDAATAATANPLLVPMVCDVTDPTTVQTAVQGTRAVFFAASASKKGGTPAQVDNEGLVNVARACIAAKVPHLVIVSSGSVTQPESPVFKFLNLFGSIMEEKIKGEDAVRGLYAKRDGAPSTMMITYTVIRPGGLTEEPARGVQALELNQGDMKTGRISRLDLAQLCVETTLYPKLTGQTTFECYEADTGKTLQEVGFSNLFKKKAGPSEPTTGRERRGESFAELFSGLEYDTATAEVLT